jgi:hypothetical protein
MEPCSSCWRENRRAECALTRLQNVTFSRQRRTTFPARYVTSTEGQPLFPVKVTDCIPRNSRARGDTTLFVCQQSDELRAPDVQRVSSLQLITELAEIVNSAIGNMRKFRHAESLRKLARMETFWSLR